MTGVVDVLRAIAETYEEAGMPVPLDIQARLVEAGDIIEPEENTPE